MEMTTDTGAGQHLIYDRYKELKAFEESKAGVKGVVDARIQKIPRMFVRPQDELTEDLAAHTEQSGSSIFETPKVDLQGQDTDIKKLLHLNGLVGGVNFGSNFDLYVSKYANWRDTLKCNLLSPEPLDPQEIPDTCRDIVVEYGKHMMTLSDTLTALLSEALGLRKDHLRKMDCNECLSMNGTSKHSDPTFFTILLQDYTGGLQFLHQNHWFNVKPIPGTFVVNIGDILQLISNDNLKSV
ncbi:hypothetical protein C5167_030118 [Papaver somniferum]|nr:hypothetical protein C5167_030118 [Papaver somniferum]